jgi:hypothetical protein
LNSIKSAHSIIISDISSVLECAHSYKNAHKMLEDLEQDMFSYFKLQDSALYDQLDVKYQDSERDLKILFFLRKDADALKVEFLEFMDEFPIHTNDIRMRNFGRKFYAFSRRILERIAVEEEVLLPILG